MDPLAREIAQRAYALDPMGLDAALGSLGLSSWPQIVPTLTFDGQDTGGGCMMLVAEFPGTGGHQVGLTDGDAGFPTDSENFWVGILDPDGDELHSMFVKGGELQS